MWGSEIQQLSGGRGQRIVIQRNEAPVPYHVVLRCWQEDESFRAFFIDTLARVPFKGYRWETPPITTATASRSFEFVVLDAPALDRPPDPDAFAEQLRAARDARVVAFANLGRDAVLVVPLSAAPLRRTDTSPRSSGRRRTPRSMSCGAWWDGPWRRSSGVAPSG